MPGLNPQTYLLSQGWAGPGHPLNPTTTTYRQKGHRGLAYDPSSTKQTNSSLFAAGGNGLIRPLLVSKKSDNLGLGRRAHEPAKGTEWWLKGFESALSSVGDSGASTPTGGGDDGEKEKVDKAAELQRTINAQMGRFGGLYSFFVAGGVVGGTLPPSSSASVGGNGGGGVLKHSRGQKRKSEALDGGDETETNGQTDEVGKRQKRDKKRQAKDDFASVATFLDARDKDVKRRKKTEKLDDEEGFGVVGEFLGAVQPSNKNKAKQKSDRPVHAVTDAKEAEEVVFNGDIRRKKRRKVIADGDGGLREETKEERRARRETRRQRRAARRTGVGSDASSPDEQLKVREQRRKGS